MNYKIRLVMMLLVMGSFMHMDAYKPGFTPYMPDDLATMIVTVPGNKLTKDYAINVVGSKVYDSKAEAESHGVKFNKNNIFEKGELVILAYDAHGYIFGIVSLHDHENNTYVVQRDTDGEDFKLEAHPEQLGKIS